MTAEFKKIKNKTETRFVLETMTAGGTGSGAVASVPSSLGVLQKRLRELKDRVAEMTTDNAEYNDEAGMADNNLETLKRAVDGLDEIINAGDNLPEWCQEKIAVAKSMLVSVWDYMLSEKNKEMEGVTGGLAGGAIGAAITKTPSGAAAGYKLGSAAQDIIQGKEINEISADTLAKYIPAAGKTLPDLDHNKQKNRVKSMSQAASKLVKKHDGEDALAKLQRKKDGYAAANEGLRDPKDNPCWKDYYPVGTKKKNGKTVPNCVPKTNEGFQIELSWSSLDEGMGLEDKFLIFEEYYIKGNLSESNDDDTKDFFVSLFDLSEKPIKNKKYIAVPTALVKNKLVLLDKPKYIEYLGKTSDRRLVFRSGFGEIRYPSETIRDLSMFNTFIFSTSASYDKFRTAISLKFDTALPEVNLSNNIDEVAPKGWEGTVKSMKKHKDINNPWALAHWMKGKGYKSHKNESYWKNIGFNIRSDDLWPATLIESDSTKEQEDFFNWFEEQKSLLLTPNPESKCILAMIIHTGEKIKVVYGVAKYIDQTESHYILEIPSGQHQYSKKNQLVFDSKKSFEKFLTLLNLKFKNSDTDISIEQMPVMETERNQTEDLYLEHLASQLAEKIPPGASVDYYIKDFAKSNAPQFRGKSPEKRRQMAIAAHYAAQQPKKTKRKR